MTTKPNRYSYSKQIRPEPPVMLPPGWRAVYDDTPVIISPVLCLAAVDGVTFDAHTETEEREFSGWFAAELDSDEGLVLCDGCSNFVGLLEPHQPDTDAAVMVKEAHDRKAAAQRYQEQLEAKRFLAQLQGKAPA